MSPARRDWVHVACSWYHDIAPAQALGIQHVWLDRERTGEHEVSASAHVHSAADVVGAVDRLLVRAAAEERAHTEAPACC
jgi:FMN phosphatase YigB (HAD superfamily)